jgi:hypothetical protein
MKVFNMKQYFPNTAGLRITQHIALAVFLGLSGTAVLAQDEPHNDQERRAQMEAQRAERIAQRAERQAQLEWENPALAAEIAAFREEREAIRAEREAEFRAKYPEMAALRDERRQAARARAAERGFSDEPGRGFRGWGPGRRPSAE